MRHQVSLVATTGADLGVEDVAGVKILKVWVENMNATNTTVIGSRTNPVLVTSSGYTVSTYSDIMLFIKGSGGAVSVSSNPQIASGQYVGQRMKILGTDDTNTVTFTDGNGLSLNGNYTMNSKSVLMVLWDGTNWVEESRNDL